MPGQLSALFIDDSDSLVLSETPSRRAARVEQQLAREDARPAFSVVRAGVDGNMHGRNISPDHLRRRSGSTRKPPSGLRLGPRQARGSLRASPEERAKYAVERARRSLPMATSACPFWGHRKKKLRLPRDRQ